MQSSTRSQVITSLGYNIQYNSNVPAYLLLWPCVVRCGWSQPSCSKAIAAATAGAPLLQVCNTLIACCWCLLLQRLLLHRQHKTSRNEMSAAAAGAQPVGANTHIVKVPTEARTCWCLAACMPSACMQSSNPHYGSKHRTQQKCAGLPAAVTLRCVVHAVVAQLPRCHSCGDCRCASVAGHPHCHCLPLVPLAPAAAPAQAEQDMQERDVSCSSRSAASWCQNTDCQDTCH
jgi:hypothetical protein